jgi:large subunit ribosomal protein L21
MSYAIIQLQGKQYRVAAGETLTVDRLENDDGSTLNVSDVLLVNNDEKVVVGTPFVPNAVVELKVLEKSKGEKIRVFKYKSKSRYRKTRGHRQAQTVLSVVAINA